MLAELSAEKDVGKGTVCCNLDKVVTKGTEWGDKVWVILVEFVVLGDVYQEVAFNVLILGGPDLFTAFVDDGILVRVVVGSGAGWGGKEVREELGFQEDEEREDAMGRSRRG